MSPAVGIQIEINIITLCKTILNFFKTKITLFFVGIYFNNDINFWFSTLNNKLDFNF